MSTDTTFSMLTRFRNRLATPRWYAWSRSPRGLLAGFVLVHLVFLGFALSLSLSGAAFNGELAGKVSDHLAREFAVAEPTADLFLLVSMLSNEAGRRVLIVAEHKLLGIVTRTDALKALDAFRKAREEAGDGVNIETVAVGWSALTD